MSESFCFLPIFRLGFTVNAVDVVLDGETEVRQDCWVQELSLDVRQDLRPET